MTKEEKAKELFNKYYSYLKANLMNDEEAREDAKECALIAVDEVLNELFEAAIVTESSYMHKYIDYYQEVKQEIEKL